MNRHGTNRNGLLVIGVVGLALTIGVMVLATGHRRSGESTPVKDRNSESRTTKTRRVEVGGAALRGSNRQAIPAPKQEAATSDDRDTVTIYLVDEDNKSPISSQHVSVGIAKRESIYRISTGQTDALGRFRVSNVRASVDSFFVNARRYIAKRDTGTPRKLSPGQFELRVALSPGLTIHGHIDLPPGLHASDILIEPEAQGVPRPDFDVNGDGRFSIYALESGKKSFVVLGSSKEGAWSGHVSAEAGTQDVAVQMMRARPGDKVVFRIQTLDIDGQLVASSGSLISLSSHHSSSAWFGVSPFNTPTRIEHVAGAKYFVFLHADPERGLGEQIAGPFPLAQAVIQRKKQCELVGVVQTIDGDPIPGVKVRALMPFPEIEEKLLAWKPSKLKRYSSHECVSDSTGQFRFEGLANTPYVVDVSGAPGPFCRIDSLRATPGQEKLIIELRRGEEHSVTVIDEQGIAIAGARVFATFPRGSTDVQSEATTNEEGVAELRGLLPDRDYRIDIQPPPRRKDVLPVFQEVWNRGENRFVLPLAHQISGRIIDRDGKPVKGIWVRGIGNGMPYGGTVPTRDSEASLSDGYTVSYPGTRTDSDGRFVLVGLRKGQYTLSADGVRKGAKADAGAKNVTLMLDRGALPIELNVRFHPWNVDDRGKMAYLQQVGSFSIFRRAPINRDGVATFNEVSPTGKFNVCVLRLSGGRGGYKLGITPSTDMVHIDTHLANSIRGQLIAPDGHSLADIEEHFVSLPGGPLGPNFSEYEAEVSFRVKWNTSKRSFEILDIPPGTWPISIYCEIKGKPFEGSANGRPGEHVEIALTEQSDD